MFHRFPTPVSATELPTAFTFPFHYTPHPLCIQAAELVKQYLGTQTAWADELQRGKMFGVLLVQDASGEVGYLAAFSGNLMGRNHWPYFVPPIYDLLQPDGFFKQEEQAISRLNQEVTTLSQSPLLHSLQAQKETLQKEAAMAIAAGRAAMKQKKAERDAQRTLHPAMEADVLAQLVRTSQHEKAAQKRLEQGWKKQIEAIDEEIKQQIQPIEELKNERKRRSAALQEKLFKAFRLLNAQGEEADLLTIFAPTVQAFPPAGSGECALPKLLQHAYLHQLRPLSMAEFWWGDSPVSEIRVHGQYYPACKGKCEPILHHMLQGLVVAADPLLHLPQEGRTYQTLYEDDWLLVVDKPAGMPSVSRRTGDDYSLYHHIQHQHPQATGPLLVHRLDMDTSGLVLIAKDKETHRLLQQAFETRQVEKKYVALLDTKKGDTLPSSFGSIDLPIAPRLQPPSMSESLLPIGQKGIDHLSNSRSHREGDSHPLLS